jgi:hypothetical protein
VSVDDGACRGRALSGGQYAQRFEGGEQQVVFATDERPILQGSIVEVAKGIGTTALEPGAWMPPVDQALHPNRIGRRGWLNRFSDARAKPAWSKPRSTHAMRTDAGMRRRGLGGGHAGEA